HILKGSANTVGVRGIAAITHRLEDLLQLLAARPDLDAGPLHRLLDDAADCVAEMCEAVAGDGPAPQRPEAVHAGLLAAIRELLGGSVSLAGVERDDDTEPDAGAVSQPDFARVPGQGTADEESVADVPIRGPARGDGEIRVPAAIVERLLALVDEASIVVAQAREQVA